MWFVDNTAAPRMWPAVNIQNGRRRRREAGSFRKSVISNGLEILKPASPCVASPLINLSGTGKEQHMFPWLNLSEQQAERRWKVFILTVLTFVALC
jgi:hypothetical protein